jgi:hypothetical protein
MKWLVKLLSNNPDASSIRIGFLACTATGIGIGIIGTFTVLKYHFTADYLTGVATVSGVFIATGFAKALQSFSENRSQVNKNEIKG